jgi:2-amino-4-hydroxy-6-hydroxymethyldihydropteridine diphosphokinase
VVDRHRVLLALGANLGDREKNMARALGLIGALAGTRVLKASKLIESAPQGGPPGQGMFLNGAAEIETDFEPERLLDKLKDIERALGRKPGPRWGPREIDIDIILFGGRVVDAPALKVPHPRFRERLFALAPLAEIAPDALDPVTGKTVRGLLADLKATQ